jgi:hypothetical protein
MTDPVSAGRLSKLALKCAIEGSLRFVSDVGGDLRDAPRCTFERPRRQVKPPPSQIRHGWLGEVSSKVLNQRGPGNAHLKRQIRDRPRMGNAAVKQPEAFPHDRIARSGQPSGLEARNVAPQNVDKQRLGEFSEHGFAADPSRSCFFDQVQDGVLEPVPGAIRSMLTLNTEGSPFRIGRLRYGWQVIYPQTKREMSPPPPACKGLKSRDLILELIP